MKKVLVVGAGAQGAPCASILARDTDVAEIVLGNVKYIISWPLSLFTNTEEKLAFYRRFGTSNIGTALPAIVGAKMCVQGEPARGLIAPECLEPTKFLKVMANMGAPVKFSEVLSKEVAIL